MSDFKDAFLTLPAHLLTIGVYSLLLAFEERIVLLRDAGLLLLSSHFFKAVDVRLKVGRVLVLFS